MSESDSFISEVTDEIRRERLFRSLRRYGWLIAGAVLLIVGGVAYHEFSQARDRAAAQVRGDALRAAMDTEDPAAQAAALAALPAGPAEIVARLAAAGAQLEAGDAVAAGDALEAAAADGATPDLHRGLAALQRVMALGPDLDPSERLATLDGLAAEGAPFRPLALEQRALLRLETGDAAAALADLQAILATQDAPEGVRSRAQQLAVASGGAEAPGPAPADPAADPASGG